MNNEGMGSWGFLAFLIFAIFAFGGNGLGGGFGGRNMGYGNAGTIADIGITSQLDNIQSQNFYNSLNSGISGIQSALCQGFAGINQTINNTAAAAALQTSGQTREILAAMMSGFSGLGSKIDQNTISALQTENSRLYADKSNLLQSAGFNERICGLEKQFQSCCCSTTNSLERIWDKLNAPATTTGTTA